MLRVQCSRCNQESSYDRRLLGQEVTCLKGCGKSFILRLSQGGKPNKPKIPPPGPSTFSFADMPPGFLFDGRYKIRLRLDRGAFGVVYRATDKRRHREVALKIPHDAVQLHAHYMERFAVEAKALRMMEHPNIVRFYKARLGSRPPYLVTEFIDGPNLERSLDDRERREGMEPRKAARLVAKLARALHHAHSYKVVHRDVKPANILMDRGEPKLTDFGLARHGDPSITGMGARIGTPFYMSPEQVSGDPDAVQWPSDQYSLGVVLYQLLCGRLPFRAGTAEAVYSLIIHHAPVPPRVHAPGIPEALEAICLKALSKAPAARWGDCGVLADQLDDWHDAIDLLPPAVGAPPRAEPESDDFVEVVDEEATWLDAPPPAPRIDRPGSPPSPPSPTPVQPAGPRWLGSLVGFRKAFLVRGVDVARRLGQATPALKPSHPVFGKLGESVRLGFRVLGRRLEVRVDEINRSLHEEVTRQDSIAQSRGGLPRGEAGWAPVDDRTSSIDAPIPLDASASPAGSRRTDPADPAGAASADDPAVQSYLYFLERAHKAWLAGDPDAARKDLASCRADHRGWEWAYLHALTGSHFRRLPRAPGDASAVACDPTGRSIIAVGGESLVLWGPGAPPRKSAMAGGGGVRPGSVAVSPDGRCFATSSGYAIAVREATGHVRFRAKSDAFIRKIAFCPDGSAVAAACGDGSVRIWACPDGGEPIVLPCDGAVLHGFAFHPDPAVRRFVAASSTSLRLWDWSEGRELAVAEAGPGGLIDVAFHPDGRTLVTASRRDLLAFWDADGLRPLGDVPAHAGEIAAVAFHPSGRWVVSIGVDHALRIGDAARQGAGVLSIPLVGSPPTSLVFQGAGGDALLTRADGPPRVWAPPSLWDALDAGLTPDLARSVALAPDGRLAAVVGLDGSLALRDTSGREAPILLPPAASGRRAVAFHPSGRRLAEACDDGRVRVVEAASTARVLAEFVADPDGVLGVAFRDDGEALATAGASGAVELWTPSGGEPIRSFDGHEGAANAVAFLRAPGPDRLISGGDDRVVRLWGAECGGSLVEFEGHARAVVGVGASRDGRRIASVGLDRTLRIWPAQGGAARLVLEDVDLLPAVDLARLGSALAAVGEDHALLVAPRT